ncbi:MAG: pantoate--beta-alanine ligase [Mariprofundaceae bacterium]|nr:pantoate--beta-alanine ligase [Mariprofundaceae bacterium]
MLVIDDKNEMTSTILSLKKRGDVVSFVPTMGCLHEGHLSLIQLAKQHSDVVVVSIYVNPLQFGPHEDLDRYPRPIEDDLAKCMAEGVAIVFCPKSLYPRQSLAVSLHVSGLDQVLCGQDRVGHFDGVATAVCVLFNIVQPDIAIFGEKDFQQLCILRRMVEDLSIAVAILAAPIARASDGLALSSRNRYLSDEQRKKALLLSQCLQAMVHQANAGEESAAKLLQWGHHFLSESGVDVQYLEVRESETLQTLNLLSQNCGRVFVAARIGHTRLIDNLELPCKSQC